MLNSNGGMGGGLRRVKGKNWSCTSDEREWEVKHNFLIRIVILAVKFYPKALINCSHIKK